MSTVDDILAILDVGLQSSSERGYPPSAITVETHNGEILASFSYAAYLENDYQPSREDRQLMTLVKRGHRRLSADGEGWFSSTDDVPGMLFRYVTGGKPQWCDLAVNHDHTCREEPFVMAGPWPHRDGETDDRWAVLVWVDVGYMSTTALPDYAIVVDGEYGASMVGDLSPTSELACTAHPDHHRWEYPDYYNHHPYAALASYDGARCPDCGAQLSVSFSVGENGYYDSAEIPWNGGEPCPECDHADHFGSVCDGWPDKCGCPWPYELPEDVPTVRLECVGQLALALP